MEGTNCSERALLPEKSMREKLSQLIEDDFSKVTLVNTLKYFKQKSGKNECVDATNQKNQINQICKKLQLKSKMRINKCVDSGTISII